ncbi:hypothetical protein [Parasedimentitalea denitrificans]|uniref:hypothetical protein n=1 Tax=Parasedimentitalea denitrificans TaxID=2211118 RepID=UPI001F10DF54|nr:hypothetical protein [Sedimentitalea sp. CY04]
MMFVQSNRAEMEIEMNQIAAGHVLTPEAPKGFAALTVLSVQHYTDRLFAFKTERPPGFVSDLANLL